MLERHFTAIQLEGLVWITTELFSAGSRALSDVSTGENFVKNVPQNQKNFKIQIGDTNRAVFSSTERSMPMKNVAGRDHQPVLQYLIVLRLCALTSQLTFSVQFSYPWNIVFEIKLLAHALVLLWPSAPGPNILKLHFPVGHNRYSS